MGATLSLGIRQQRLPLTDLQKRQQWAGSKRIDNRPPSPMEQGLDLVRMENPWSDEHTANLKTQLADDLAAQYGAAERELHRQFVMKQLTPQQYNIALRQMRVRRAGDAAKGKLGVDIERTNAASGFNQAQAQLNLGVWSGSQFKSMGSVGGGRGKEDLGSPKTQAARWAMENLNVKNAKAVRPEQVGADVKMPGTVRAVWNSYFNKHPERRTIMAG